MDIFIPTLGRTASQPTLLFLQGAGFFPTLVVQAHEYQDYRMSFKTTNIVALPPHIRSISPTRQWILENAPGRHFAMFDDDLRFSRKSPADRSKLLQCTVADLQDMVAAMKSKLNRYACVGLSSREGNNRKLESHYLNERMMRVLAYDKEKVPPSCRFDRIQFKQDFDMTLQLLRHGLANCVIYEFANDQVAGSNARGGCSTFRDQASLDKAAQDLHDLHPDFVRLVEKDNSNWKGIGAKTRLEVQVAWKRAYDAGRARRGVVS